MKVLIEPLLRKDTKLKVEIILHSSDVKKRRPMKRRQNSHKNFILWQVVLANTYVVRCLCAQKGSHLVVLLLSYLWGKSFFFPISFVLFCFRDVRFVHSHSPPHLFVCTLFVIALMENGFLRAE